jgi:hypothetical protein
MYETNDVAAMLNVAPGTVRLWAKNNLLPSVQLAPRGKLLFPAEALKEAIAAKLAKPQPQPVDQ